MTDAERFPLLTEHGRQMLQRLREHPHAPRYTAQCGNRLTADYLRRVLAFEAELNAGSHDWSPGAPPEWLDGFVEMCFRDAPFYRRYGARPANFHDIPTIDRADLSREIWSFVPDALSLDDLIIYATSGTTGHPLTIPSHPIVGACYTPLIRAALARRGIELKSGAGKWRASSSATSAAPTPTPPSLRTRTTPGISNLTCTPATGATRTTARSSSTSAIPRFIPATPSPSRN